MVNSNTKWPLLVEPEFLQAHLNDANLLIVDLCSSDIYRQLHVPSAIHVEPAQLVSGIPPAMGQLPSLEQLSSLFSSIGLTADKHVVAYDDEGGGWAGRFLWTLDVIGHQYYSYLNGGLVAWYKEGYATDKTINHPDPSNYKVTQLKPEPMADLSYIMQHLQDSKLAIWDARSANEYHGLQGSAQRLGHIPGAINYEWTRAMDQDNNLRLRPEAELKKELGELGLTPDKEIITHCQTHHRSGFTYLVAKILGYPHIKGYAGSWSEWGNRMDTPVEK